MTGSPPWALVLRVPLPCETDRDECAHEKEIARPKRLGTTGGQRTDAAPITGVAEGVTKVLLASGSRPEGHSRRFSEEVGERTELKDSLKSDPGQTHGALWARPN